MELQAFLGAGALPAIGSDGLALRVQATVLDSNLASRRVLERAGFHAEGLLAAYRVVRGEPRDFWMYARTRDARPRR